MINHKYFSHLAFVTNMVREEVNVEVVHGGARPVLVEGEEGAAKLRQRVRTKVSAPTLAATSILTCTRIP